MNESTNVKEHMLNLINALANLSPSRNIISQLILLLPEDLAVVEHSYPEATSPDAKGILESLGVKFGEKVERINDSFAEALHKHIHKTFDWLDDECLYVKWIYHGYPVRRDGYYTTYDVVKDKMSEVRSSLAKLMDVHVNSIPNPYLEWAKLVLKKLSTLHGKDKIIGLLKALLARDTFKDKDWQLFLNEVRTRIGADPAEFEGILRFIIIMGEREHLHRKGSRRHSEGDIHLEHAKYHLDPLLYETYGTGYEGKYIVRHKETLIRALEEAFA